VDVGCSNAHERKHIVSANDNSICCQLAIAAVKDGTALKLELIFDESGYSQEKGQTIFCAGPLAQ